MNVKTTQLKQAKKTCCGVLFKFNSRPLESGRDFKEEPCEKKLGVPPKQITYYFP